MREIRSDIDASAILDLVSPESEDATNVAFHTRIIDASCHGLKVESPIDVVSQQLMAIQIAIDDHHFRLSGCVKWCEEEDSGGFTCGVFIDPEDSSDLIQWKSYLADEIH